MMMEDNVVERKGNFTKYRDMKKSKLENLR